jgi:hypothetical protein
MSLKSTVKVMYPIIFTTILLGLAILFVEEQPILLNNLLQKLTIEFYFTFIYK